MLKGIIMKRQLSHKFEDIVSVENLLEAWREFIRGKRKRRDVQEFSLALMDNIFQLHHDLKSLTYRHGGYQAFKINFMKHRLKAKYYIRYADDFVIFSENKEWLEKQTGLIKNFCMIS